MRTLLIAPAWHSALREGAGKQEALFPPFALPLLVALTPADTDVRLVDEAVETLDPADDVEPVGISAMMAQAPRAYEVAGTFRSRGVKVVLGGRHPSGLLQEAAQHAGAVVVGEAEIAWPRVIRDVRLPQLRRFHGANGRPQPAETPVPRRSLLKQNTYLTTATVQASPGCPFACSSCAVSNSSGRTYRFRRVEKVIEEVAALKDRVIVWADDELSTGSCTGLFPGRHSAPNLGWLAETVAVCTSQLRIPPARSMLLAPG
jgi:radical SAM superfamily enzyme YgiQ (UPF0313 family)